VGGGDSVSIAALVGDLEFLGGTRDIRLCLYDSIVMCFLDGGEMLDGGEE
jgi:hypothetical protein